MSEWTLFSNHGHVLVCLARNSEARLRDVAPDVGITERAVQKIVRDLQDEGMISVTKNGRRNSYRIHGRKNLRHDLESACTLKDLIRFVNKGSGSEQGDTTGKVKAKTSSPQKAGPRAGGDVTEPPSVKKKKPVKKPQVKTGSAPKRGVQDGDEESMPPESKERQQGLLF